MAAGSAFAISPNTVITEAAIFHNVITQSESMRKDYQNVSTTPTQKYNLIFELLSNADRDSLREHYEDQSGGYYLFSWQSVPDYINSGGNLSGRWEDGSLKMTPRGRKYWKCSIIFEVNN